MIRNLKALGLAFVAVFAMSALAATAAQAEGEEFHSEASHTVLTGESDPSAPNQVFTINSGGEEIASISCNEVNAEGDVSPATSPEATVGFSYTQNGEQGCEASIGGTADVDDSGCHYTFYASEDAEGHADVDLTCPSSLKITAALGCTITIPNQTVHGIHYNSLGNGTITGEATVEEDVNYTASFACQLIGIPGAGEADYFGNFVVAGYVYEGGETGSYKEGNQVAIEQG